MCVPFKFSRLIDGREFPDTSTLLPAMRWRIKISYRRRPRFVDDNTDVSVTEMRIEKYLAHDQASDHVNQPVKREGTGRKMNA